MSVVTTEPEWDDESRGRALRLAEYEASLCPCGCGLPVSVAHNKDQAFRVVRIKCAAGRAIALKRRQDAREAEKAGRADGWADGLHYAAEPVNTPEHLRRKKRGRPE